MPVLQKKTIITRMIIYVTVVLFIMNFAVIIFTRHLMKEVVDDSQGLLYREKCNAVESLISREIDRLEDSAPETAFTKNTLNDIADTYYSSESLAESKPMVIDSAGIVLLTPSNSSGESGKPFIPFTKWIAGKRQGEFSYRSDGMKKWCSFYYVDQCKWTIVYVVPFHEKYSDVKTMISFLVPFQILVTLIVLLFLAYILRKKLRPIATLTRSAALIAEGNLDHEIETEGELEIATLTHSFITMRDAIRDTISELKKSKKDLSITLNSIGDAVIAADALGVITTMNPVAEKMTGWSSEEANGKKLGDVFKIISLETREKVEDPIQRIIEQHSTISLETNILVSRDENEFKIANSCSPIMNDNKVVGAVLVFHDITQQKELEEQLFQSRKMDAVGQLAGGVAHDFNNMLAAILNSAELIKDSPDELREELTGLIVESAERAADLTDKLLAFSRKGTILFNSFDIHSAIKEAVSILEYTVDKKISISSDLAAEQSTVMGDLTQLQSVFLNMGINSSHAIEGEGEISFKTEVIVLDEEFCSTSPFDVEPGRYVKIEVNDTGAGIPLNIITHIFEPFFTTKEQGKGTGLGLAAAYGTILQHKGVINVYSEIDRGTTFHIYMPISEVAPLPCETPMKIISGQGTILVVDDEEIIRTTAELMLKKLGYKVICANDGVDGVEKFTLYSDKVDLVILDMIMPKMDGRECFELLKTIRSDVKVVMASGFTRDADIEELKRNGLLQFLRKPYRISELSQLCSKHIPENDLA